MLLVAPGLTTIGTRSDQEHFGHRYERSDRTLLGAPGVATRNNKLLVAPGVTTTNKKLVVARSFNFYWCLCVPVRQS